MCQTPSINFLGFLHCAVCANYAHNTVSSFYDWTTCMGNVTAVNKSTGTFKARCPVLCASCGPGMALCKLLLWPFSNCILTTRSPCGGRGNRIGWGNVHDWHTTSCDIIPQLMTPRPGLWTAPCLFILQRPPNGLLDHLLQLNLHVSSCNLHKPGLKDLELLMDFHWPLVPMWNEETHAGLGCSKNLWLRTTYGHIWKLVSGRQGCRFVKTEGRNKEGSVGWGTSPLPPVQSTEAKAILNNTQA